MFTPKHGFAHMDVPEILKDFDLLWIRDSYIALQIFLHWEVFYLFQFETFLVEIKHLMGFSQENVPEPEPGAIVIHQLDPGTQITVPKSGLEDDTILLILKDREENQFESMVAFLPSDEFKTVFDKIHERRDTTNPQFNFEWIG